MGRYNITREGDVVRMDPPEGPGKGDDRRPQAVDDRTLQRNWCRTFSHSIREDENGVPFCTKCDLEGEEILMDRGMVPCGRCGEIHTKGGPECSKESPKK